LWLVGYRENLEPEATDTDIWALENNYVAVTPVTLDVTDYALLKSFTFE
jgi:5'-nucleotidase